ncbi:transcriptional regulator GlxA family with amidase domain [Herbaspirillum sp. Sphag1AN]|uniref:helix-turn-helix domain-containing protein n=1 Tax=unclassified Herbaspirillum TaxID=2624150 RepID=UPI00161F505B|nr:MULTISPECIES: helix-turn-helix domain-containing protein [unclassified Herbaspirillum]MBB3213079.1 transcriptional regulator GlxA family with amidase domain [Herbaspirillum sp. Sphag1AN]MBB3246276.1 transcriptional regulator GlxA family with amidase domain [Herbaspirillum sp. Sphag64]
MHTPLVAVVAFNQISPFHLAVPCAVFGDTHPDSPRFQLRVCGAEPGPLRTTAGFDVAVMHDLSTLAHADTIIIPSWRNPDERAPEPLLAALVAAQRRGAQVVGLCLGAYVLAQAGLLEGHRATTHWAFADDFAARFPEVLLDADVLYVEEDNLITSAGTAAGIDCCLHLIRQRHGAESASLIARRLVVPPHRQGGQAQFVEQPISYTARGSRLAELIDAVRASLHVPHTLDTMATQVMMSRRTFTRQFRQTTGISAGEWLLNERLALSQRLLEGSDQPIERIAELAGFGTASSLRSLFKRAFGVTPSAWRQSFKG